MRKEWSKKKFAIYLRRSKGEKGSTANQLEALLPKIKVLEKAGLLKPINRDIVGKDITKQIKFDAKRDLALIGGVFNEGEGASGFKVAERPVFMELLKRVRSGEFDGVIAPSMDRFARNYGAFSRYAYDLFGDEQPDEKRKMFWGLQEQMGLGVAGFEGETMQAMISSLMDWGALAKKQEIRKAEDVRIGSMLDKGYMMGSKPEWIGKTRGGNTSKGVNYRAAWQAIQAGKTGKAAAVLAGKKVYDKRYHTWGGDTKWANTWINRMRAYDELDALDNWLDAIDAVEDYIKEVGAYPKVSYQTREVTNLISNTAGFFAYPAGLSLAGEDEWIVFPNPILIGIDRLAATRNPLELEDWLVEREPLGDRKLNLYQTQPRAGGAKKKTKKRRRKKK
jgi:hypothetical protein